MQEPIPCWSIDFIFHTNHMVSLVHTYPTCLASTPITPTILIIRAYWNPLMHCLLLFLPHHVRLLQKWTTATGAIYNTIWHDDSPLCKSRKIMQDYCTYISLKVLHKITSAGGALYFSIIIKPIGLFLFLFFEEESINLATTHQKTLQPAVNVLPYTALAAVNTGARIKIYFQGGNGGLYELSTEVDRVYVCNEVVIPKKRLDGARLPRMFTPLAACSYDEGNEVSFFPSFV